MDRFGLTVGEHEQVWELWGAGQSLRAVARVIGCRGKGERWFPRVNAPTLRVVPAETSGQRAVSLKEVRIGASGGFAGQHPQPRTQRHQRGGHRVLGRERPCRSGYS